MPQPTISGATQVVCVIGDPIHHSLSPAMHNAALKHAGIDAVYVGFHVLPAQLRQAVGGLRALKILGANVTVPHKEHIIRFLDSISHAAEETGAVNTVIHRDGKLFGENTDVIGLRRALDESGVPLRGKRVLLLGAGGAARAVLAALEQGQAGSVVIANRSPGRGARLARRFRDSPLQCTTCAIEATENPAIAEGIDLVINSTTVGLLGEPFLPLPYTAFSKRCVFYDLIPSSQTGFLAGAHAARRRGIDGLGMLLHQGAAAFELWTGQPAPVPVMRRALRRALRLPRRQ